MAHIGMVVGQTPDRVVHVAGVERGSPASLAGIRVGERLVSFGGMPTYTLTQFRTALKQCARVGASVRVVVVSGTGADVASTVVMGQRVRLVEFVLTFSLCLSLIGCGALVRRRTVNSVVAQCCDHKFRDSKKD